MPLAVTHVLLTIIVIDLYRDYVSKNKKYFSLHTILIGGIAGLLPDIDIPLAWVLNYFGIEIVHGSFTHTPWFAMLFLFPALIFRHKNDKKRALIFYIISFGIFFHIFLDWLIGGGMEQGIMWFYPFAFETSKIHLLSKIGLSSLAQGLDAVILLLWLWHEEVKHKISDFI